MRKKKDGGKQPSDNRSSVAAGRVKWLFSPQERSLFPSLPCGGVRRNAISAWSGCPLGRPGGGKTKGLSPLVAQPHCPPRRGSVGARQEARGRRRGRRPAAPEGRDDGTSVVVGGLRGCGDDDAYDRPPGGPT